ncbi:MAG: glycosyltransferase family 39 protein [Aigarchaeota archaeon]|nr:glycosyltransferase family 39 protein [Aigarchaeota archaeon]MDW8092178.1 glycosyltransferase family 39 protein [Nitrososphaerota archaeon]
MGLRSLLSDHRFVLSVIALVVLLLKLAIIQVPTPDLQPSECYEAKEGCGFIFDEAHYVPAVRKMISGLPTNNEHPPLTKWLMILGISIFGDGPLGWRIIPVLTGSMNVFLVGMIAFALTRRRGAAYVSSVLYGTDVTTFNISSMGILDTPSYTFLLLTVLLVLKGRTVLPSITLGLAMLCKMSALFGGIGLMLLAFLDELSRGGGTRKRFNRALDRVAIMSLLTSAVFVAGIAAYDFYYRAYPTPFAHIDFMMNYHSSLRFNCVEWNGPISCTHYDDGGWVKVELPLGWSIPGLSAERVPYYVVTVEVDGEVQHPVAYYGISGPLWWVTWGVFASCVIGSIRAIIRIVRGGPIGESRAEIFVFIWIVTNYMPYFGLAYLLQRWVFSFYFVQTLPSIAIGLAALFNYPRFALYTVYFLMAVQLAWFTIWFPVKPEPLIELLRLVRLPV